MSFAASSPYSLPLLPPPILLNNADLQNAVAEARTQLGELKGLSLGIPNPFLLISPAVLKESLSSSEIENIHTTLVNALQAELFPESERPAEDKEVHRYRDAVLWGTEHRSKLAISSRLILGIHKKLVTQSSGEYRKIQNRIQNTASGEVIYTPPIAADIPRLVSNWENFVNEESEDRSIDPLIRVAMAHYQFEAIHPFEDGNGRVGRILMVLQLMEYGLLSLPVFFISGYIHRNRAKYYRLLNDVSQAGAWSAFLMFMLEGFRRQAQETKTMILKIMVLNGKMREEVRDRCPKVKNAGDFVEHLFRSPVTSPVHVQRNLKVHYTTATRYLNELVSKGFLKEKWVGKNHFFFNHKLLSKLNKNWGD